MYSSGGCWAYPAMFPSGSSGWLPSAARLAASAPVSSGVR